MWLCAEPAEVVPTFYRRPTFDYSGQTDASATIKEKGGRWVIALSRRFHSVKL
jgi:hypothetical protein